MLSLFRQRPGFAIFLSTQALSNLGDAVRQVVVPLIVLQKTGSAAMVAGIIVLETAPAILMQLPFGVLLDRWDRRLTMLAADLGRALIILAIVLVAWFDGPLLWALYVTAVPLGLLSCLFGAGHGAITPMLVERQRMSEAYGLVEGAESLAWIVGPVLAGLIAASIGAAEALAIDAVSFLVSAIGLGLIRLPPTEPAAVTRASLWRELGEGLGFLFGNPALRRLQQAWTLYGVIGYGIVAGLLYVGSVGGHADPIPASLAVALYALGSAAGTLAAGRQRLASRSGAVSMALALVALGSVLIATGLGAALLVGAFLFGAGEGFFLVIYLTRRAELTPDRLMARIAGAAGLMARLAQAIAAAWMGLALEWLGAGAFALLALLAVGLAVWASRAMSKAD